jgi:hypothetical protein
VTRFLGGLYTAGPNRATGYPGNIGHFEHNRFTVVPELTLTVSYDINSHWRVFGGYNFLYWSDVIRPGDQIDRVLDVTNVPNLNPSMRTVTGATTMFTSTGQNHPDVPFKESGFWAQGLNFGVEFRY